MPGWMRFCFLNSSESKVTLTNGSGVFSAPLGEFALAAMLYFAKDFPRMRRNQIAGRWEPFDVLRLAGQTVGIVGYGDIGKEGRMACACDGDEGAGAEAALCQRRGAIWGRSTGCTRRTSCTR